MDTSAQGVKPPPLHNRNDVFEEIATLYNSGNDLELVQNRYRGALMMLNGSAIPKGHSALVTAISTYAEMIDLGDDALVQKTIAWIGSEERRHAPSSARPSIDDRGTSSATGCPDIRVGENDQAHAG